MHYWIHPSKKQLTWIKAGLFLAALLPLARLFWLDLNDHLTANPVEFVERSTGTWVLAILLITLGMTPIRLSPRIQPSTLMCWWDLAHLY